MEIIKVSDDFIKSYSENTEVMRQIMCELLSDIQHVEYLLQVEQNTSKIATLQGQCAGYRTLCKELKDAGFPDYSENKITVPSIMTKNTNKEGAVWYSVSEDVEYESLNRIVFYNKMLQQSEEYKALQESLNNRIEEKKKFLYYVADKGRDLFFIKGWHEIITYLETRFDELQNELDRRTKDLEEKARLKKEQLPFDDEDD